jgi:tetratricopeptide (TPR) repeat protein
MAQPNKRDRVFVSYSHLDSDWLDKVRSVLDPDVRNGRIQYFDDRELEPGDPWYKEITDAIDHAKVAVLLVSPNFLASRFIGEDELPRILRAVDDDLTTLWIPLSGKFYGPDAIAGSEKLADRQAVWDASQPLDSLPEEGRTARLLDLCRRINAHMAARIPFNMPFGSLGDLFKGREEELRRLDEQLKLRGASAILQPRAISGLGGIGKTRLAIEYAHRHRADFTALLFVSANTRADLEANLARLCADDKALDLPEFRRAPQAEQYAAVVRWLSQNTGWLVVLDNVDTEEALEAVQNLAASLHGGHILITSRLTGWGGSVRTMSLDVIPLDDAVALLLQKANEGGRQPRPDDAEKARVLATELGCLPLAITHAGAYVRWGNKTFDRYLSEFDKALAFHKKGMIEYDPDPNTDRVAKTVATTYFLSIHLLGPSEKSLLRAASILAPEPIPVAMFEDCPDEYKKLVTLWCEESGEAMAERDTEDALSELANYSLVERGDNSFSVHRMERLVLSHRIPKETFPKWVEATRAALEKYAPDETAEDPKTWPVWDKLRPHAEALVAAQRDDGRISPSLPLLITLGQLYFGKGLYNESLAVDEAALALAEQTDGPECESVADRLLAYGETLRVLGRYAEAELAFRRSIQIKEKLEGSSSTEIADTLNYMALVLDDQGRLRDAEHLYRRALEIYESNPRANDIGLAKVLINLGRVLNNQGFLAEAQPLVRRGYALHEQTWGPDNPRTLIALAVMAELETAAGNLADAEAILRRAAEGFEKVLGKRHPMVARVWNNVAVCLRQLGKLAEAERLFRHALEIDEVVWGKNHTKVAHRLNNLAGALLRLGMYDEAVNCCSRGWLLKGQAYDLTSLRILIMRMIIAVLEGTPWDLFLGQAKTLAKGELLTKEVAPQWEVADILSTIALKHPEEWSLLTALATATNDNAKLSALDVFAKWKSQPTVPLDMPWPHRARSTLAI